MKPVRGSVRPPLKVPNSKGKKRSADKTRKPAELGLRGKNVDHTPTAPKKRKNEGEPSVPTKIRSQENWKPMTKSSITALESILELSVLSALKMKGTQKEETQEHLNEMKKRFLAHCLYLKVPVQRQGGLKISSGQLEEETKKSLIAKETLKPMEEELKNLVSNLELIEEKISSLDYRCSKLREELEEEEEKAQELLKMSEQGILGLPAPPQCIGTTLQARLMKMVSNTESESTAGQLGNILENSASIQNAQVLLAYANKYTDQLLSSGTITAKEAS